MYPLCHAERTDCGKFCTLLNVKCLSLKTRKLADLKLLFVQDWCGRNLYVFRECCRMIAFGFSIPTEVRASSPTASRDFRGIYSK